MRFVFCTTPLPNVVMPTIAPASLSCTAAASISLALALFSLTIIATGTLTPFLLEVYVSSPPLPSRTVTIVHSPSNVSAMLTTSFSSPPGLFLRSITRLVMFLSVRSFTASRNSSAQLPLNMLMRMYPV